MNRRAFVASAVGLKLRAAENKSNLLLPSDTPYEHQLRLMWYNPVCEARAKRSPSIADLSLQLYTFPEIPIAVNGRGSKAVGVEQIRGPRQLRARVKGMKVRTNEGEAMVFENTKEWMAV